MERNRETRDENCNLKREKNVECLWPQRAGVTSALQPMRIKAETRVKRQRRVEALGLIAECKMKKQHEEEKSTGVSSVVSLEGKRSAVHSTERVWDRVRIVFSSRPWSFIIDSSNTHPKRHDLHRLPAAGLDELKDIN
ncbi:Uncharacterized protein TCAP_00441 [Tolypocladium capitatum]|uniref:Uncharacterized protein n=1 Tax=Tolypocladium capitatum TaxID=45235 RepID=A0A2K3QQ23_9HYPO|nr:Uncharacterized protein TCAP_00441 [Tolypocladium capitatum]